VNELALLLLGRRLERHVRIISVVWRSTRGVPPCHFPPFISSSAFVVIGVIVLREGANGGSGSFHSCSRSPRATFAHDVVARYRFLPAVPPSPFSFCLFSAVCLRNFSGARGFILFPQARRSARYGTYVFPNSGSGSFGQPMVTGFLVFL